MRERISDYYPEIARRNAELSVTGIALSLIVFTASIPQALAQDDVKPAITWFDSVGYPDLSKAELVKVTTAQCKDNEEGEPKTVYEPAFLVKTEGEFFTVMRLGLNTETYMKSAKSIPEISRATYQAVDLKRSVNEYFDSLKKPEDSIERAQFLGRRLSSPVELFVLARACDKRGLAQQASQLIDQARKIYAASKRGQSQSFRQNLIDDIAQSLLFEAIGDFE
jgi:hypothetical protein